MVDLHSLFNLGNALQIRSIFHDFNIESIIMRITIDDKSESITFSTFKHLSQLSLEYSLKWQWRNCVITLHL